VLNSSKALDTAVFILEERREGREDRNAQVAGSALSGVHHTQGG